MNRLTLLPYDIWLNILPHLDHESFLNLCQSTKNLNHLYFDEYLQNILKRSWTVQIGSGEMAIERSYVCDSKDEVLDFLNQDYRLWYEKRQMYFTFFVERMASSFWSSEEILKFREENLPEVELYKEREVAVHDLHYEVCENDFPYEKFCHLLDIMDYRIQDKLIVSRNNWYNPAFSHVETVIVCIYNQWDYPRSAHIMTWSNIKPS